MPMPITTPTSTATPSSTDSPTAGAGAGRSGPPSEACCMPAFNHSIARQGGDGVAFDAARVVRVVEAEADYGATHVDEVQRMRAPVGLMRGALHGMELLHELEIERAAVGVPDAPLAGHARGD